MECTVVRSWLFRKIDDELSPAESALLDSHLNECHACMCEFRILALPRRIGRAIPALEPSPYFYRKLKTRIEGENQSITIWQLLLGLSRQVVPALAAITLALLTVFVYLQFQGPRLDVQAYDRMLLSGDRSLRMVVYGQGEITDENVLNAIAEQDSGRRNGTESTAK